MILSTKIPERAVIYTQDVQNMTGLSRRSAERWLQTIRKALGKSRHQFVTFREFCAYTGIDEEVARQFLRD